jgi:hypothetical protein
MRMLPRPVPLFPVLHIKIPPLMPLPEDPCSLLQQSRLCRHSRLLYMMHIPMYHGAKAGLQSYFKDPLTGQDVRIYKVKVNKKGARI